MKYLIILLLLISPIAEANIGKVSEQKGNGLIKRTTGDKVETKKDTGIF